MAPSTAATTATTTVNPTRTPTSPQKDEEREEGGAAPPSPLPEFVYKITPTPPPDPIPEAYPLSDLDRTDGFVHLSTAWQIPKTATLFFHDAESFHLLKLRLANFPTRSVKWDETPGTNGCPHLYGNFGVRDVVAFKEVRRRHRRRHSEGEGGEGDLEGWVEALEREVEGGWLV